MQIKTISKYLLTPVRMTAIKKKNVTNTGKDVDKREHLLTCGNVN